MGAQDRTRDNESGAAAAGAEQPLTTEEHRLVYLVLDDDLVILQCRYHYEDR